MPELLDDAEERVDYRLRLVEDRRRVAVPAEHPGLQPDLVVGLDMGARAIAAQLGEWAGRVEQLHDGRLFRAEVQVAGFWTLSVRFLRMGERRGWFFGARPEFYFPRLPFSWSKVGTAMFFPGFAAMVVVTLVGALQPVVTSFLP